MPGLSLPTHGRRAFSTGASTGSEPLSSDGMERIESDIDLERNDPERDLESDATTASFLSLWSWLRNLPSGPSTENSFSRSSYFTTSSSLFSSSQASDERDDLALWHRLLWYCLSKPYALFRSLILWLFSPTPSPSVLLARFEQKLRIPVSVKAMNYNISAFYIWDLFWKRILPRFVLFSVGCLIISLYWSTPPFRSVLRLYCAAPDPLSTYPPSQDPEFTGASRRGSKPERPSRPGTHKPRGHLVMNSTLDWAKVLLTAGYMFCLCQGYSMLKVTRERMSRLASSCNSACFSALKNLNPLTDSDNIRVKLETDILEFVLLCVALPVATIQLWRGNRCDPDITGYCREAAKRLSELHQRMRAVDRARTAVIPTQPTSASTRSSTVLSSPRSSTRSSSTQNTYVGSSSQTFSSSSSARVPTSSSSIQSATSSSSTQGSTSCSSLTQDSLSEGEKRRLREEIDHFCERFCCHLEMEYLRKTSNATLPQTRPLTRLHIVYNLRCHCENFADNALFIGRSSFRDAIEATQMASRDLTLTSPWDMRPRLMVNAVLASTWLWVVATPIRNCDRFIIDSLATVPKTYVPAWETLGGIFTIALLCAFALTLVWETWYLWNALGGNCINTYAYTLQHAQEIDGMLNEFWDDEPRRKHAYMPRRHDRARNMIVGRARGGGQIGGGTQPSGNAMPRATAHGGMCG